MYNNDYECLYFLTAVATPVTPFNPHGTAFPKAELNFTVKFEHGFATLTQANPAQPLSEKVQYTM